MPEKNPSPCDASREELISRWLSVQAVLAPALKELLSTFQGEGHALMLLSREDAAEMSPSELARAMGITAGRASNLLGQLERKGLVERHRESDDLRAVTIRVTPDGSRCAQSAFDQARSQAAGLFELLDDDDAESLVRIGERLASVRYPGILGEEEM